MHAPVIVPDERVNAIRHFPRRLVGERNGKYPVRRHVFPAYQVSDLSGKHPRFSAAGPGKNELVTAAPFDGFLLFRIEFEPGKFRHVVNIVSQRKLRGGMA
jgi:hypothetical protein